MMMDDCPNREWPLLIQGGMGAAVSGWRLARAVSAKGQLGVVSGTALAVVLARRLGRGDPGGHMRQALAALPLPGVAERILDRYLIEGGKAADEPFKSVPMPGDRPNRALDELVIAANFAEVWLAKQGHDAPVGVNLLEKIQLPTPASLYGAMLAGVDFVLMGAGIPLAIPGILDKLAAGQAVELRLDVASDDREKVFAISFDPARFHDGDVPKLKRPKFLAIISSVVLAQVLAKKASGKVDGFIVEGPTAGGHNAPPRGKGVNERQEPIYGPRDQPDLAAIAKLGRPFWLAGSDAAPARLAEALEQGAAGVQIGTAFAFCAESGLSPTIKRQVLAMSRAHQTRVHTDPAASPTGFPFKVLQLDGTLSDAETYAARPRICDLGYLRQAYEKTDGSIGWRCPAEPVEDYVGKGGDPADAVGRKCVCNGLLANVELGQLRARGETERAVITCGDDVADIARFAPSDADSYDAANVIHYMLSDSRRLQVPIH